MSFRTPSFDGTGTGNKPDSKGTNKNKESSKLHSLVHTEAITSDDGGNFTNTTDSGPGSSSRAQFNKATRVSALQPLLPDLFAVMCNVWSYGC